MRNRLLCKYKFKFYLNASHYIIINGKQGEIHPHTWEFIFDVVLPNSEFIQFSVYERTIEAYFATYQNHTMNDVPPFNTIIPTLENMVEHFGEAIGERIRDAGGQLEQIEGSETPTRSYIISYAQDESFLTGSERSAQTALSAILDQALKEALN